MKKKWIYYDSTKDKLYNLNSFDVDVDNSQVNIPFMNTTHTVNMGGYSKIELNVNFSSIDSDYITEMYNDVFTNDGRSSLKSELARTIILMDESGMMIEFINCILLNISLDEIENFDKVEINFCADAKIQHFEGTDSYYRLSSIVRGRKIDKLLE